jgi:hypothetical protein
MVKPILSGEVLYLVLSSEWDTRKSVLLIPDPLNKTISRTHLFELSSLGATFIYETRKGLVE